MADLAALLSQLQQVRLRLRLPWAVQGSSSRAGACSLQILHVARGYA